MATLRQNVIRTINDLDDIKSAIQEKGVTVGRASVDKYGDKIRSIKTNADSFEIIELTFELLDLTINYEIIPKVEVKL